MFMTTYRAVAHPPLERLTTVSDLRWIDVHTLARWCAEESRAVTRDQPAPAPCAYELFRRALVERDEIAWEYLYQQYVRLVEHWVRRNGAYTASGESSEYFVAAAFTRFWKAIPAERFSDFPNLGSLLNYLRRCAACVVIDGVRAHSTNDLLSEDSLAYQLQSGGCAAEEATENLARHEFWRQIAELVPDESERFILHASFVLGMKPVAIAEARPDLFADVATVYNMKRNVLCRLRRNPLMQELV